jgi:hypothetical protein
VLVRIRRLDRVAPCVILEYGPSRAISEHTIAGHFEIEDVFFAVLKTVWQNPLDTLSPSRQALKRFPILGPDCCFIATVPVELNLPVFLAQLFGNRKIGPEPMGRPRRPKGLASVSLFICT